MRQIVLDEKVTLRNGEELEIEYDAQQQPLRVLVRGREIPFHVEDTPTADDLDLVKAGLMNWKRG